MIFTQVDDSAPASICSALQPGQPYPLGATWTCDGVNFAVTSRHAAKVELCLFDPSGETELQRLIMPTCDDFVWHGLLPHTDHNPAAIVYGYRIHGDYVPERGHRFNPAKLLLDPYARDIVGSYHGEDAFQDDDPTDTAHIALKARIHPPAEMPYDWESDVPPRIAHDQTVIYELHVKGFTKRHPAVPQELQGTYAGLTHPAVLDHLASLGVTTVNLLPVHQRADEARLQKAGMANYWGYSSIGFFAPEPRYWSKRAGTTAISEFRDMVRALHSRGIEVVLDVVYNHTGETDAEGPMLSFRGIDNALYYHLQPGNLSAYENWTGCGNTLNLSEPRVLQLVMDSLRYWVQDMHVDGFRFDLAPILARDAQGFSEKSAFFAALLQDPVLAGVKLIAEPWDIGPGGYQLGNFPDRWLEWNDRYRDTMRAFWLRRSVTLGDFAHCLAGSSTVFRRPGRRPTASVNFITAHDGFTLADLVSYSERHNQDNGENNSDGHGENLSINGGMEGPTDNADIMALRGRLKRALLATLFLSQGTPMLLAGDELGNSQRGNNNAYCQDNHVGWLSWAEAAADQLHLTFVGRLIHLRKRYAALRHGDWHAASTLTWLAPSGAVMSPEQWHHRDCVGVHLDGSQHEDSCLLLFNADTRALDFALPHGSWQIQLDSSVEHAALPLQSMAGSMSVPALSVIVAIMGTNS